MENKNHVITSHNVEQKVQKSVRSDVVIPNKLGNGKTCQGLRHWRLLSNLGNNFSKPVRNDKSRHPEGDNPKDLSTNSDLKPSPEFVSSSQLTNKIYPLTGREGKKNGNELINLSTHFKEILRLKPQDDENLVPQCPSALMPFKKKVAFTLAETLITLGIIGVVAALTIPGLINNYKAQRLRSQFLKSYSTVQQVFKQMEADDVSLDPNSYNAGEFYIVFARYLSGASLCKGSTEKSPLCPNAQTRANNLYKGISNWYLDDGAILLQDGTLLMFENTVKTANPYVFVTVDLNGIKNPPNMEGFDVFTFHFQDGILRTMGDKETKFQGDEYCDLDKVRTSKETNNIYGIACAQKAKEDADYFQKLVKKYK